MSLELGLVSAAAVLAGLPFLLGRRRLAIAVAILTLAVAATAYGLLRRATIPESDLDLPRQVRRDGFTSSKACRSCHPSEYASWHRSYHRSMTQVVNRDTVLGDFDDVRLSARGRDYHLTRDRSGFYVDMVDPAWDVARLRDNRKMLDSDDAPRVRMKVVMSTGSHNMQAYWVPLDHDRSLFQLPWVWVLNEQRWIPREDAFLTPATEDRTPAMWNVLCIRCHTTAGRPGLMNPNTMHFDSEVADLGIACESCHGPAAEHVEQNRNPLRRYRLHFDDGDDGGDPTVLNPARVDHKTSSSVCGQCHSFHSYIDEDAWYRQGDLYRAGDDLDETRRLARTDIFQYLSHNEFWPDGTYRVGGREFTGLIATGCYQKGELGCLSCHRLHDYEERADQLAPGMRGDDACLPCHQDIGRDVTAHTHHPEGSSGSLCYNCHMPYTTYALFKSIRNHKVASPTLVESARHQKPNACNLCHLDQTLAWTGEHLADWYGQETVPLTTEQRTVAASVAWIVKGDAGHRIHMAWHYGWEPAQQASGTDWMAPYLAQLLDDPYGAVRHVAYRSLRSLPGYAAFDYDFIGSPEHRADAHARALAQWSRRPPAAADPALLLAAGGLDQDRFQSLRRRRDNRVMSIHE